MKEILYFTCPSAAMTKEKIRNMKENKEITSVFVIIIIMINTRYFSLEVLFPKKQKWKNTMLFCKCVLTVQYSSSGGSVGKKVKI